MTLTSPIRIGAYYLRQIVQKDCPSGLVWQPLATAIPGYKKYNLEGFSRGSAKTATVGIEPTLTESKSVVLTVILYRFSIVPSSLCRSPLF